MISLYEPSDFYNKPSVQIRGIIDGADSTEHILIPGGQHPRMRLISDAAIALTWNLCFAWTTGDSAITVRKGRDRKAVGAFAGGLAAIGDREKCTPTAEGAGVNENISIFERYDDVVIQADGAANAATCVLVQLSFEVVE